MHIWWESEQWLATSAKSLQSRHFQLYHRTLFELMVVMRVIVITLMVRWGETYKIITWPFCGHIISSINVSMRPLFSMLKQIDRHTHIRTYTQKHTTADRRRSRVEGVSRQNQPKKQTHRKFGQEHYKRLCMYNVIIQNRMGFLLIHLAKKKWKQCKPYRLYARKNSRRCPGALSLFPSRSKSLTELSTLHKWHWVKCLTALYRLYMSVRIQMSTCNYITRYGYCLWPLNLTDHQDEPDT